MKRVFIQTIAALVSSVALIACAPSPEAGTNSEGVRVLAPAVSSKGSYSLDVLNLEGIADLQTMTGKYARFFVSPRIVDGHLDGMKPRARFVLNKNNEHVPANDLTQQLVTIYFHMQKLAQLDSEMGAEGVNKWPRDVGVLVRLKGGLNNNAYYDGQTDSMLFVPYTNENLPIAVNGGILAHEHFHSLFYKLASPDFTHEEVGLELRGRKNISVTTDNVESASDKMDAYYKLALVRGMNEGMADFWGWMYSGDPDFIAQSLPKESGRRSLSPKDSEEGQKLISDSAKIQNDLATVYSQCDSEKIKECVIGYAYKLAPQYSRFLKQFSEKYAQDRNRDDLSARKEVAKILLRVLPKIKSQFAELAEKIYTPTDFIISFMTEVGPLREHECAFVSKALNDASTEAVEFSCKNISSSWVIEKKALQSLKVGRR